MQTKLFTTHLFESSGAQLLSGLDGALQGTILGLVGIEPFIGRQQVRCARHKSVRLQGVFRPLSPLASGLRHHVFGHRGRLTGVSGDVLLSPLRQAAHAEPKTRRFLLNYSETFDLRYNRWKY